MSGLSTLREVNIKYDLPSASDAIKRITFQIYDGKRYGLKVIKLIHGYGSTGKGGKIRVAAHRYLDVQKARRVIDDWFPGDVFTIFNEDVLKAFRVCDDLRYDTDLERHNNGVTFVLL
ncbi:MAG: hypothetical protein LBM98_00480 [Oscillospiraceae bacterium]|jgi:hypothetical protein|nr:hypothetical protein [Oscillospiraceae bacterium]